MFSLQDRVVLRNMVKASAQAHKILEGSRGLLPLELIADLAALDGEKAVITESLGPETWEVTLESKGTVLLLQQEFLLKDGAEDGSDTPVAVGEFCTLLGKAGGVFYLFKTHTYAFFNLDTRRKNS